MAMIATRLTQEAQAGRKASSDVFLGTEGQLTSMREADVLEPIAWADWSLNVRDPRLLDRTARP